MCNEQLYKQYFYVFQSPAFQAMSDAAKNVYGILMSWAIEEETDSMKASVAVVKIAETANISERQAYNLIRELKETGIITPAKKKGRFSVYNMKPALDFRRGHYCENGIPETPLHVSTHEAPLHVSADSFPLTPAIPATPEAPLHTKALTKHLQNKRINDDDNTAAGRESNLIKFPKKEWNEDRMETEIQVAFRIFTENHPGIGKHRPLLSNAFQAVKKRLLRDRKMPEHIVPFLETCILKQLDDMEATQEAREERAAAVGGGGSSYPSTGQAVRPYL